MIEIEHLTNQIVLVCKDGGRILGALIGEPRPTHMGEIFWSYSVAAEPGDFLRLLEEGLAHARGCGWKSVVFLIPDNHPRAAALSRVAAARGAEPVDCDERGVYYRFTL